MLCPLLLTRSLARAGQRVNSGKGGGRALTSQGGALVLYRRTKHWLRRRNGV